MPHQLWKLETLNQHINRSRIIPTLSTVNPTEARENLESEEEEDIEVAEEAASLKNAMPFRPPSFPALPIAFAFYQSGEKSDGEAAHEPERTQGGGKGEPHELSNVFASMAQERAASDIKLAIGVAKKCCPICRMLKGIAQDDYQVQLDLPGQHGVFHRWVPPRWLPIAVLDEIEKRLLPIVSRLADTPIPGSRASSPASDLDEDRNELPSHIGKPRSLSILQHWNIV